MEEEIQVEQVDNASDVPGVEPDHVSLEEQVLDYIEGQEEVDGEQADSGVVAKPAEMPTEVTSLYDGDGNLAVKEGDKLTVTKDMLENIEKSGLRMRDYTQKTQEVAEVRRAAQEILAAQEQINTDPRALRQYFKDEQILQAFTREEMLNYGLAAGGVPVQAWNQFLEWFKESGEAPIEAPRADPYVHQFGTLQRRMESIEQNLTRSQQMAQEQQRKAAYDAEMNRMGEEVDAALKDFPDVNKKDLLVLMGASDGTKSVKQLAEEWNSRLEARFNEYLGKKQEQRKTTVKSPKGSHVPIRKKAPESWEEAGKIVSDLYGDGSMRLG